MPEQGLHQQRRIDRACFRLQHQAHILGALVAHIAQDRDLAGVDQLGDALDQFGFLHLVGDLGDDDLPGAPAQLLDAPGGAQPEPAAPGAVGLQHAVARLDQHPAGGEIGPRDHLDQGLGPGVRVADQVQQRLGQLAGVVRRDRGRHADRDAGGAVGEQVGEGGGQNLGLLVLAVEGGAQVDRVLVHALQQGGGDVGQAGLGVAVGGGPVAVDVAEVALAVDQRIAQAEVLRRAHQRVVDRLVAVGVILADHVADHAGGLLVALAGVELELAHGPEQPAVDRLQPVAGIRQGPVHDRREGIGEVALAQRAGQGLGHHPLHVVVWKSFVHRCCVTQRKAPVQIVRISIRACDSRRNARYSRALSFTNRNHCPSLEAAGLSDLTEKLQPRHPARGNH